MDLEEYQRARREVEAVYGPRLKGRSREECLPIAKRMLSDAGLTQDLATRYVLTQRAVQILAGGGDVAGAVAAVEAARRFLPGDMVSIELGLVTAPSSRVEMEPEMANALGKVCLSLLARSDDPLDKTLDRSDRKRLLVAAAGILGRTNDSALRRAMEEHLRQLAGGLLRQGAQDAFLTVAFVPHQQHATEARHWAGAIQRWIIEDGKQLRITPSEANVGALVVLHSLAPSSLGVTADGGLWLWDSLRREFAVQLDRDVCVLAVTTDGRVAASAGNETIRLWNIDGRKAIRSLVGHKKPVTSVVFSGDRKRLLSGSADGTARLWDVESGKEMRCLSNHAGAINSVAISADGRFGLSAGEDKQVVLWDLDGGKLMRAYALHQSPVVCVGFTSSPDQAVSSDREGMFHIWELSTGTVQAAARIDWSEIGANLLTTVQGSAPPSKK